jgi:hypothetical protein
MPVVAIALGVEGLDSLVEALVGSDISTLPQAKHLNASILFLNDAIVVFIPDTLKNRVRCQGFHPRPVTFIRGSLAASC